MSELIQFSENFWEWMNHLAGSTRPHGFTRPAPEVQEGLEFSPDGGGETIYYLDSLPDGWVRFSESDRGSTPQFRFDFADMERAESYLCVQCGNMVREKLGLARHRREDHIDPKSRAGRESPDLQWRVVDWAGPVVYKEPCKMRILSVRGKDFLRTWYPLDGNMPVAGAAASMSWYADRSLVEVLESLRNPTGAPLFELLGERRA